MKEKVITDDLDFNHTGSIVIQGARGQQWFEAFTRLKLVIIEDTSLGWASNCLNILFYGSNTTSSVKFSEVTDSMGMKHSHCKMLTNQINLDYVSN